MFYISTCLSIEIYSGDGSGSSAHQPLWWSWNTAACSSWWGCRRRRGWGSWPALRWSPRRARRSAAQGSPDSRRRAAEASCPEPAPWSSRSSRCWGGNTGVEDDNNCRWGQSLFSITSHSCVHTQSRCTKTAPRLVPWPPDLLLGPTVGCESGECWGIFAEVYSNTWILVRRQRCSGSSSALKWSAHAARGGMLSPSVCFINKLIVIWGGLLDQRCFSYLAPQLKPSSRPLRLLSPSFSLISRHTPGAWW